MSSGRCSRRTRMPMSDGLLMTVSMRSAPVFLEVLLDAAVLVGEVDVDVGAGAEDPRLRRQRSQGASPGGDEHGSDLLGGADADVVVDEGLEEPSGPAR